MLTYQLLRPLSYLSITDDSKWKIDYLVPALLSIPITFMFTYLPYDPKYVASGGIVSNLIVFLSVLPGFYITALAAVSTFDRPEMDQHMPEPTPKHHVMVRGVMVEILLTRRRMLSLLFGYLSFLSICLLLVCVIAVSVGNVICDSINPYRIANFVLLFLFLFPFFNMISVTMFGLYQLCERIHSTN